MRLKALIYARVSTTMQEDNDSLKYQILKAKEYCYNQNYDIFKILEDVESGGKDDRDGFIQLKKEIDIKSFDVLVVFETSRISRKMKTLINFIDKISKNDIKFVSISQPELNTISPTGNFLFNVYASLAELEREQTSIRVKTSKLARAKDGIWQGGFLPLGYIKDKNGEIIIKEEEAKKVKEIFCDYLTTHSFKKVSEYHKLPVSTIQYILKNKFYLGLLPYGKQENILKTNSYKRNKDFKYFFKGKHKSIIDEETFNQVQSISELRSITKSEGLLFSGLLRCTCGSKMYRSKTRQWNDYKCSKCKKSISQKKIEPLIFRTLLELDKIYELNKTNTDDAITKLLYKIEYEIEKIKNLEIKKGKLIELLTDGIIDKDEFIKSKKEIDFKIDDFNKKIETYQSMIDFEEKKGNQKDNVEILKSVVKNFDNCEINDLKEIFRLLIEKIEIIKKDVLTINIILRI